VLKLIEDLLAVQDLDQTLLRLRRELNELPARKQHLMNTTADRQAGFKAAEDRVHALQSEIKQQEIEADSLRERIQRYRTQQNDVKTNDEYRALEHEIADCTAKISGVEDRELERMEALEAARAEAARAKQALDDAVRAAEAECAQMDVRGVEMHAAVERTEALRAEAAQAVPEVWMKRFERILNNRGDAALVPILNGVCGGCHMTLPRRSRTTPKSPKHPARFPSVPSAVGCCIFARRRVLPGWAVAVRFAGQRKVRTPQGGMSRCQSGRPSAIPEGTESATETNRCARKRGARVKRWGKSPPAAAERCGVQANPIRSKIE
jgi:uncharacterized protein